MVFNSQQFLEALLGLDYTYKLPKPVAARSAQNFADYMAMSGLGVPSLEKVASDLTLQSQEIEQANRGALSETFGWLGSLGIGVENMMLDVADVAKEREGDFSLGALGDLLPKLGSSVAGAVGTFLEPVQEAVMIPGWEAPGEESYEKNVEGWINKNNYYREGKPVYGARVLEELGVFPENNKEVDLSGGFFSDIANAFKSDPAKFTAGLGLDILTDPLTYAGPGLIAAPFKALKGAKTATQSLSDLATISSKVPVATKETENLLSNVAPRLQGNVPLNREFRQPLDLSGFRSSTKTTSKIPGLAVPPKLPEAWNFAPRKPSSFHNFLAKSDQVLNKKGVNPHVVTRAIDEALPGVTRSAVPTVAGATGRGAALADEIAESFSRTLGQKVGNVTYAKKLNPANQARLFKQVYNSTANRLPEELRKLNLNNPKVLKWRRDESLRMLRSAEDNLRRRGIFGEHWVGSGLRLSDVIAEVTRRTPNEHLTAEQLNSIVTAFKQADFSKITNPTIKTAIETAIGRRAADTGFTAKLVYDDFATRAQTMEGVLSSQKYEAWLKGEAEAAAEQARVLGFTPQEAGRVKELVASHVGRDEVLMMDTVRVLEIVGSQNAKAVLTGVADAKAISQIQKTIKAAVDESVGKTNVWNLGKRFGHFTGINFTTWMGRGSQIHKLREGVSVVTERARANAEWFSRMLKDYNHTELNQAFAAAQRSDVYELVSDPRILKLADQITDYFENIFGSSRILRNKETGTLKALSEMDGTVAFRSQMIMEDVNKHLTAVGSNFQFKNYADADTWLTSWERVNPHVDYRQNPVAFLYNLDIAVQRTLLEYNLIDNFVMQFGRRFGEEGFDRLSHTTQFPHRRVDPSIKFPPKEVETFRSLIDDFDKGPWRPESKAGQMYVTGLRRWKSTVTIYYPSHHIRNLIGDSWLMWMSGINDPRIFNKALHVIGTQRPRYQSVIGDPNIDALAKFRDGRALRLRPDGSIMTDAKGNPMVQVGWAQTEGRNVIIDKFKSNISADEIYGEMLSRGLLKDVSKIEDLAGDIMRAYKDVPEGPLGRLAHPFGGKVHNAASKVSEVREHYVRIAHMIGYVEKHMGRDLGRQLAKTTDPVARSELMKPLLERASREVTKWHPDGTDLSRFEQKWMRNIIPFYSWFRKAIPLTLEGMVMRPGKITAIPKANFALQQSLGIEAPGGLYDPLPVDQMFPDWIRAQATGPLGDPESDNPFAAWIGRLGRNQITPFGTERGYTLINPMGTGVPFQSFVSDFGGMGRPSDALRASFNMTTPAISIPAELGVNTTSTGAKIAGEPGSEGYASYLLSQIPQGAPFQRMFGIGKDPQEGTEPGFNWEALINMLTAAGLQGTGKYTKSAQYDERDRRR